METCVVNTIEQQFKKDDIVISTQYGGFIDIGKIMGFHSPELLYINNIFNKRIDTYHKQNLINVKDSLSIEQEYNNSSSVLITDILGNEIRRHQIILINGFPSFPFQEESCNSSFIYGRIKNIFPIYSEYYDVEFDDGSIFTCPNFLLYDKGLSNRILLKKLESNIHDTYE